MDASSYRRLYLSLLALCYACAYLSWLAQSDGLTGAEGLLPMAPHLDRMRQHLNNAQPSNTDATVVNQGDRSLGKWELFRREPVLTWWAEDLQLDASVFADGVALTGLGASLLAIVGISQHGLIFAIAFICYLTLFKCGQTFYSFQWDILLLEVYGYPRHRGQQQVNKNPDFLRSPTRIDRRRAPPLFCTRRGLCSP